MDVVKRYFWSTVVTFAAGFAIVVAPQLDDNLTLEAVKSGALVGVLFAGVRAGIKGVLEAFIAWRAGKG